MAEDCSHKAVVESSSLSISTVLVAQSGRAEDCGSLWHGFKSHLTPQYTHIAQLVRARILYIQGQGFKSLCEYYLGVPEWSKGTDCKSDDSWVQIPPPSLNKLL